jgi:transporter family protein
VSNWLVYALVSAVAAAATAIFARLGVQGVPSTLATAIRTLIVVVFTWSVTFALGEQRALSRINARTLAFLLLSGLATGVSWLAYFRALQLAGASRVAPIDKLSLGITVILAVLVLHEPLTLRLGLGVALMIAGALLTLG